MDPDQKEGLGTVKTAVCHGTGGSFYVHATDFCYAHDSPVIDGRAGRIYTYFIQKQVLQLVF
jgi:hypothetical protein